MEEDKQLAWTKHLTDVANEEMVRQKLIDRVRGIFSSGGIGSPTSNLYSFGVDPYDKTEEEKPMAVNMNDYIHKDEMVQILLDSRHALFTDRIPSVLEVIEWIEERKKQQL